MRAAMTRQPEPVVIRGPSSCASRRATTLTDVARLRRRTLITLGGVLLCLAVIGAQLVRLALRSGPQIKVTLAEPLARSWSRPDIVDRNGRLLASDIAVNSLYADPLSIQDRDEAIEKLVATLPGLEEAELRKSFADRGRRFVW